MKAVRIEKSTSKSLKPASERISLASLRDLNRLTSSGKNRNGRPLNAEHTSSIGASTQRDKFASAGQKITSIPPGLSTLRNSRSDWMSAARSKCSITPRFQMPSMERERKGRLNRSAQRSESKQLIDFACAKTTVEKSTPTKRLFRRGTLAEDSPVPHPASTKVPSEGKYLSRKNRTAGRKITRRTPLDSNPKSERESLLPSASQ
jgi:hypothetical protein